MKTQRTLHVLCLALLLIISLANSVYAGEDEMEKKCLNSSSYVARTQLALPFKGSWMVIQGGCLKTQNIHLTVFEQMHALDFVKINDKGRYHKSSGKKLTDYYSYNQKIYSPADGVVIQVVDGVHDSKIGSMNLYHLPGNMVVIDHKNGEYSIIAHFKNHSIVVEEGQKIKKGDFLGLCGNSGNSSFPHLHYQLQDGPNFNMTKSLPASFSLMDKKGEKIIRELKAHDKVKN